MNKPIKLGGIIHGRVIELDAETGLPDGQLVEVTIQLAVPHHEPTEGLRKSFGAWGDDAAGLDEYLEWNRQQRKNGHTS